MNSAVGAIVGLALAIVLIVRKFSPVYSLLLGAIVGGLLGGLGVEGTVSNMIAGVKDITPAIRPERPLRSLMPSSIGSARVISFLPWPYRQCCLRAWVSL